MAIHSSILAWRIPWTEEPGGLQFKGLQIVRHNCATNFHFSLFSKEPEFKLPRFHWITEKGTQFHKSIYFCFIDCTKARNPLCGSQQTVEILQELGIPDHLTCLLRNLCAGQEEQLELNVEQWTGSKLGKEYDKAVHCHPVYFTSMKSHHEKFWAAWLKSWNQDCREKYQQPQICRW